MNYNLILEGCDCTGKTSLVTALADRLPGCKTAHMKAPKTKEGAKQEYEHWVGELNKNTGWVLDRGLLGECVYAPLMRGYYPDYMRGLEKELRSRTVLVLVVAEPAVVTKRFDGEFISSAQIPYVLHRFWCEFVDSNYLVKIVADTTYMSADELADHIIAACEKRFS